MIILTSDAADHSELRVGTEQLTSRQRRRLQQYTCNAWGGERSWGCTYFVVI